MPRVRPTTLSSNILNVNDILNNEYRLTTLLPLIDTNERATEFLASLGLLRNELRCPVCDNNCTLNAYAQGIDKFRWRCNRHNFTKSLRVDSFFDKSHLSLSQIALIAYMWSRDSPQKDIQWEANVNKNTVVDWCSFLREVCEQHLEANPEELGGIDDNGEPIVVEIDESKFFHRKYHRGQWREGHWVFGAIERDTGRCCMVEVADRSRATLEPIIHRWILPGSRIISDGWRAYHELENLNPGMYLHDVVIHEENFVNPDNATVHTQNVENIWSRAKRKLKRQYGTQDQLFTSYLHEFIWRNKFKNNVFGHLISTIREFYAI
ncbi:Uncharacterised protein r2_g3502 [Pycnogonum litorale]